MLFAIVLSPSTWKREEILDIKAINRWSDAVGAAAENLAMDLQQHGINPRSVVGMAQAQINIVSLMAEEIQRLRKELDALKAAEVTAKPAE